MYGFEGVCLLEVMLSISELSVVGGWTMGQTHFMVGPGRGPTKTMQARCLGGFSVSVMCVPKLLLTPMKIRKFGPKRAKFCPKMAFCGQILSILWAI